MPASPRAIRAVIFDLDGTLADTFPLIVSAWNAALTPYTGKTYSDADVISRFGIPDPAMIRRELSGPAGDAAVENYHAHYQARHGIVKAFDGVDDMLQTIKRRGVPMGVCTGKGRRSAGITLGALGWTDLFAAVVTGEDVERQKPAPDPLLRAAEILNVPIVNCAFVGDSPADIGAGQAAGALTVAAGWHPVYLEKIRAMRPDVWVNTPADVARLV